MKTRLLVSFTALLIIAGCASEIVSKRIQLMSTRKMFGRQLALI